MDIEEVRIGWTGGAATVSRLIQKFDFALVDGERMPSAINHVLLRFIFKNGPDLIYEATNKGIAPSPFEHLERAMANGKVVRLIERRLPADPFMGAVLWRRACEKHGTGYDWRLIILYLIWSRYLNKSKNAAWLFAFDNPSRMTCNEFVAHVVQPIMPTEAAQGTKGYTPEKFFEAVIGVPSPVYVETRMTAGETYSVSE